MTDNTSRVFSKICENVNTRRQEYKSPSDWGKIFYLKLIYFKFILEIILITLNLNLVVEIWMLQIDHLFIKVVN